MVVIQGLMTGRLYMVGGVAVNERKTEWKGWELIMTDLFETQRLLDRRMEAHPKITTGGNNYC